LETSLVRKHFKQKDAPEYRPAEIIVLATQAAAASLTVILYCYYAWANKQKRKQQIRLESEGFEMNRAQGFWGDLTDKKFYYSDTSLILCGICTGLIIYG
jgi:hypothetical protein